jgi:dual specificity MAP kinase phosphatase
VVRLIFRGIYILFWRVVYQGVPTSAKWLVTQIAQRGFGVPVMRYSRVTPHLYVGGMVNARGWERLRASGVDAIVNLRQERPAEKPGVTPEAYLCLPTPDDYAPTLEQLEQGCAFMAEAIQRGQGVYVHCASGVGRAPTLAAAYLITTGLAPDQAMATIRQVRPFINPTPPQIEQLKRFGTYLASTPATTLASGIISDSHPIG